MGYNIADKAKTKKPASVASYNSFNMLLRTADSTQVGYLYYITHSSKYCSILYIKALINACLHTVVTHYVCSQLTSISKEYQYHKLSVKPVKFNVSLFQDASFDYHQRVGILQSIYPYKVY